MKMQSILKVKALDTVVYGDSQDALAIGKAAFSVRSPNTDTERLSSKQARAKMLLIHAVDDKNAEIIEPCKDAREIWARLEVEYSDKQTMNVQLMLNEYYSMEMRSSQSISEYVAKVEGLVDRLASVKQTITDEAVIAKIISSLPQEFSSFRRTWDIIPDEFKTKSKLIENLKKEEQAVRNIGIGEAMIARSSNKMLKKRRSRADTQALKAKSKCKWCNQTGHWWAECPTRPEGKEPATKGKKNPGKEANPSTTTLAAAMTVTLDGKQKTDDSLDWYLDSGASDHMTRLKHWIEGYEDLSSPRPVRIGSGEYIYAIGKGSVYLKSIVNGKEMLILLKDVYLVPDLHINLCSVGAASSSGIDILFSGDTVDLANKGKTVVQGARVSDGIYKLCLEAPAIANITKIERTSEEWHQALGHASVKKIEEMARLGCVEGLRIVKKPSDLNSGCGNCQQGRGRCASHPSSQRPRASAILERIHVDTVGPINPTSLGGNSYFLSIKDEFSSYIFVRAIATKSDLHLTMKRFLDEIEATTQARVKIIRSDNGSEFKNMAMRYLCDARGIVQEFSAPRTPQQNGEAERANKTILDVATSMISATSLNLDLWPEAACMAAYVRNRTIGSGTQNKTPFELLHGHKPNLAHLVPFGQEVYIIDHAPKPSKFSPKTIEAYVIGYGPRVNTYRCLIRDTGKIVITSDVVPAAHRNPAPARSDAERATLTLQISTPPLAPTSVRENNQDDTCGQDVPGDVTSAQIGSEEAVELSHPIEDVATARQAPPIQPNTEHDDELRFDETFIVETESDTNHHACGTPAGQTQAQQTLPVEAGSHAPLSDGNGARLESHRGTPILLKKTQPTIINRKPPTSYFIDLGTGGKQGATASCKQPQPECKSHALPSKPIGTAPTGQGSSQSGGSNRSRRQIRPRQMLNLSAMLVDGVPNKYQDIQYLKEKNKWLDAVTVELNAHRKNGTWQIVPKPEKCKEISSKWVFRIKDDGTHKARLVARGFTQVAGVDYDEIFAPVVRMDSVRLLFAIAAQQDLKYAQFDITTAFLYGSISEELYMAPPPGLDLGPEKTLRLHRSLYGLKQAPRCWNSRFTNLLKKFQLAQSVSDPCVFISDNDDTLYLAVYVDDGLIFASRQETIDSLIGYMRKEFEVRLIKSNCFIGIEIARDPDSSTIFLHQASYIRRIIERFNLKNCKTAATPIELNHPLNRPEVLQTKILEDVPYPEIIGSLLYCCMGTRPDISYALSVLSKYSSSPRNAHWEAAKRVVRYLKETINHGLIFSKADNPKLTCFTDADWAGDQSNRRSTSGMVTMINRGPISYHAKQQSVVALSTCEAEYIAGCTAVQELVWLRRFLKELKVPYGQNTVLKCDNQSAVKLIKNPEFHKRSKHIEIRFHYIREQFSKKEFNVEYVQTENQLADIFTKALTAEKHDKLCTMIGCVASPYRLLN